MLKIDIIKFEAQDVITTSVPGAIATPPAFGENDPVGVVCECGVNNPSCVQSHHYIHDLEKYCTFNGKHNCELN